jgi:hypothetical protein
MTIPLIKTPGQYFEVNTNTQRSGLPQNKHKILFITDDDQPVGSTMPINLDSKIKLIAHLVKIVLLVVWLRLQSQLIVLWMCKAWESRQLNQLCWCNR